MDSAIARWKCQAVQSFQTMREAVLFRDIFYMSKKWHQTFSDELVSPTIVLLPSLMPGSEGLAESPFQHLSIRADESSHDLEISSGKHSTGHWEILFDIQ